MKFRAEVGHEALGVLLGVTTTLSKISDVNQATIVMNEDYFRFSVTSPQDLSHPRCYAELSVPALFLDYRIESQSANTIIYEVNLTLLGKVLSSARQSQQGQGSGRGGGSRCWLKLVKRDNRPCLSMESSATAAAAASSSAAVYDIVHDIPIRLVHISDLPWLAPPLVSQPKVALELPAGKTMKILVEKLHKFSRTVTLEGQQTGKLAFRLDEIGHGVAVKSFLHHLRPDHAAVMPRNEEGEVRGGEARQGTRDTVTVRVVMKHLVLALDHASCLPQPTTLLCMASEAEPLVLHLRLQPEAVGGLTFYLPPLPREAPEDSEEEEEEEKEDSGEKDNHSAASARRSSNGD
eukprot:gene9239-10201_t